MRYDWAKLKRKFITGKYKSIREFAKKEGFIYSSHFAQKTRGWTDEKKARQQQKEIIITEKTLEIQTQKEIDRNSKVLEIVDKFLDTFDMIKPEGMCLFALKPKNFLALAKSLESLQKVHRLGEGMDKPKDDGIEQRLGVELDKIAEAFGGSDG